jgi:carbamoyltransferase
VPHHRPIDLAGEIAELLAEGRVIAHFDGRMEFGPRALGHRSVLAQAIRPDVREDLNRRLHRTEFMPFAPVLLDDGASERVDGLARAPQAGRHMTVAFRARARLREEAPGAVHVDGTARCQIATRSEHPRLWAVLDRYRRATGRSTLINTSFNRHEEPIVCSPQDAVRTFREGGLDALALGPYLALGPGVASPGAARSDLARVSP